MSFQPGLFPSVPADLLGSDHEVFGLWNLVKSVLGVRLRSIAQDRGGYLHDPARMFAVWMYGFMQGRSSSRQLEDACRFDVRFAFLAGGTRPDHSTLARFRERFDDVLPELLSEVCQEGRRQGLVSSRPLMVDGTKLPGATSQWRRALSGASEEDSKTMNDGHGHYVIGYNAQVAVDSESTFIAASVVTSDANDMGQMPAVMDAIKDVAGEYPVEVVADSGYDSSPNHQALVERQVISYIRPRSKHLRVFEPDESGILRCPAGHVPSLTRTTKSGHAYDVYRVSQCRHCPFRDSCKVPKSSHQKEMTVRAGTRLGTREDNQERTQTDRGKALLARRGETVELVFARLKAGFRFTRFKLRNLRGARLEFALLTLAYNLRLLQSLLCMLLNALLGSCTPLNTRTSINIATTTSSRT